jgi:hypothetical protein
MMLADKLERDDIERAELFLRAVHYLAGALWIKGRSDETLEALNQLLTDKPEGRAHQSRTSHQCGSCSGIADR